MSRREALELGARAREVLNNPAFVHAVQSIEDRLGRSWQDSEPNDADLREDAYRALRALRALTDELTILLDNGELAALQVQREEMRNGY